MARRAQPERTCVGCRRRAPASDLLRIVAVEEEADLSLRPDPARRLPGRGANMHPDPACFAQALQRRAFGRALRVAGVPRDEALAEYLTRQPPRPVNRPGEGR
ncbi:DNA-binding protein [Micromonospora sonchi]|uniref:DNA-binding protein n=1 Tax=Micromonospora sonchi TaxID=1763543 RepID=A0A917TT76_9ACTN|nr:YlxR family protein [Micromonospora sonchi]GGM36138.1 DNA-binding protein [Micromonospora sonchi]